MLNIMTSSKTDYDKDFKRKILAREDIRLVDVMNKFCPGSYRVEIYTEDDRYRGFFKFNSAEWPPSDGEPDLEWNDRDCGIAINLYKKVKICDDHLVVKSRLACTHWETKENVPFKLYFVQDKPVNFLTSLN